MIRTNKNLIIFLILTLILGALSFFVLQKLFPLVSHTIYYCQSFLNSLSFPIPYYLSVLPFILFFTILFTAVLKLFIIFAKVQLSKKKLLKKCKSNMNFLSILGELHLTEKAYLIESEKQFAFCLGIRHPRIYISTNLIKGLSKEELEAVLRHERYHLNNRDTLTMLIASIGQSLLPFFPILSDLLHNYRIEREIRADAEAIKGIGDKEPLISVLKKLLITPSVAMVTVSAIADHDTLEPRICALVKKDFHFRRFSLKNIIISLASVFVISIISLTPTQAFEVRNLGEDAMMICPSGAECLSSCKQKYFVPIRNYSESLLYTPIQ